MQAVVGDLEVRIKFVPFQSKSAGSFKKEQQQVTDRCAASHNRPPTFPGGGSCEQATKAHAAACWNPTFVWETLHMDSYMSCGPVRSSDLH